MSAGHLHDLDELAEHRAVRLDLLLAHEPELACMNQQRWYAERLGRRRRRAQLAVAGDDGAAAVPVAVQAVVPLDEVLPHVLLDELERGGIAIEAPLLDGFVRRCERPTGAFAFREVEADVREELDGRIE